MSYYDEVEEWIEKFRPRSIADGFVGRNSDFIYENSPESQNRFKGLNPALVWTLSWSKEEFLISPGFPISGSLGSPEIVGFVETEIPWSSADLLTFLVVERFVECYECEGTGLNGLEEACIFCEGRGDFLENYGI